MHKWFLGFFVLLFLTIAACKPRPARLPIEEKQLISVLIDVHVAEAAVQGLRGHTKDSIINLYYEQICQIHGLDRATFESAMESLREDPVRLEKLYNEVMKEMERREAAQE